MKHTATPTTAAAFPSASASPLILTCVKCAHPRGPQPYETHHVIGGQTQAHCTPCGSIRPHHVSLPTRRPVTPVSNKRKETAAP